RALCSYHTRRSSDLHSTLSHLYIGGLFCCYLLEDTVRDHKIPGETAIPPGDYGLSLNHWAAMNARYAKRYPEFHEGMVEIIEIRSEEHTSELQSREN